MPSAPALAANAVSSAEADRRFRRLAAALANGALAHAFELDSLTRPGAGAHPGATVLPPALAIAQERDSDGRALIAAFVAGNEVMIRIGRATGHTNEARGFHAPGTTGPFGAAVAAGHLLRLDPAAMTNALGIAGSLCGGLLEFARGDGGMVKRLHLGRASEAGVLAASLAAGGFAGPRTVLEGEFGFLRVFCTKWDTAELTRGLGEELRRLDHGAEALSVPRHRACRGQGGARPAGRARLYRRRRSRRSPSPARRAWSSATTLRSPPI